MTQTATRGQRTHIGIVGRRNVGKSSLVNALTRQEVAIVSAVPGTTTDPVAKPMELQPLGPVVLIDTAGLDDGGELGEQRVQRTRGQLDRCDLVLLVAGAEGWGEAETQWLAELRARRLPAIAVFNQADRSRPEPDHLRELAAEGLPAVVASARTGEGLDALRRAIIEVGLAGREATPPLLRDLVPTQGTVVLVVPIDLEAPVGRLILPQVQAIRDVLDADAACLTVKETGLAGALANLLMPPDLVVTDSQAFAQVAAVTPPSIPLTGFSVLMARCRGDLLLQAEGALTLNELRPGDRVLVAEACSHHPVQDDIGRIKLPRWLTAHVGGPLCIDTVQGHDFPAELNAYRLVIHCGACTLNRREVRGRLQRCRAAGVPVTNYGLAISLLQGTFVRSLQPFPEIRPVLARLAAAQTAPQRRR